MGKDKYLFKRASVFIDGHFERFDLSLSDSSVSLLDRTPSDTIFDNIIDCEKFIIIPGFADVHVHLREPGFSYKETIYTGTLAAAKGGYTVLCAMPNVIPPPDSPENLQVMLDLIEKDALIKVLPYGAVTKGQRGEGLLSQMEAISFKVAGFSDDGKGVQTDSLMEEAMILAKKLCKPIVAHCEDENLLKQGGCVHAGKYAESHGLTGISSESEWKQLERDISLVRKTGCRYHVCHVSAKESVALIRAAKAEGLPVSCETAPHYLLLCDMDLRDEGRFKMNPPLRSDSDRKALLEGIKDGTIDCIATDHAPHSPQEKAKGLRGSMNGIVGIETAFPLLYTNLVKKGIISLEKLIELMCLNPRRLFKLENDFKNGNFTVYDLSKKYKINSDDFLSKGKSTPFDGVKVFGETVMTVCEGKIVYERGEN